MRPFEQIPLEEWRQVMDVNVASMFLTCRAVVPVMRERGGGKIVNISSGTPFRGVPFLLHYVTSKGAIVAFTRALAKELGKDNVLVNCVAPGFTMSAGVEAHPEVIEKLRDVSVAARTIQRDQVPEDVVGAVVFLCGPGSDFVTGQTIVIDGGQYLPLILALSEHPDGVETEAGRPRRLRRRRATRRTSARRASTGRALVWELTERPAGDVARCAATASTSRPAASRTCTRTRARGCASCSRAGSGSRRRATSHEYGPFEWWYETGPDPVFAAASETEATAFVRVLVLPAEWEGKRTIRYVDPADEEKPKLQRARVYFEQPSVSRARRQAARRPARRPRRRHRRSACRARATSRCSTASTTRRSG